ncbi:uncharacterized protein OCT59_013254 [Rhizophagus irregularis]|uniref:Uncharacterized protein n=3 Tax=Rhizophagus irregularis TaxID=588596 RepID=A0A015KX66_RHIIW|nr:hypothetical protein GLOIN_2v1876629 [Rhizophagus irregularis DAOM 181602=DAOM 197198]EXX72149.1 hypothetical protein RirG_072080 [Rhizophagus irregularis DAOM 197198w]POG70462.1 hypothetical protein GLOIN_2v1876629 [Rhizophagus irregularis DAOM 181602=DAOM 197198]UZO20842.1 hypothetical protein OCT59_013254 [Rhizophagus irregularis]GBC27680.1 hypothetical protein GLOIN_2v1876629 [Rhizophagus irregularis DAOM 181602=DAOM 197198]|eukprot:XP_025177328.1 hypothetical protein GLOIN_2v1876629 [Rhizophagus irregularis DAOM 181602=DAOM 197198]
MSQNTLQNDQNNQNDHTFTEFNNLQSTVIQPGHSSNINYNDVNANSSDNNFPTFYTDTNYSDQQPISNENISTPIVSSYAPQYVGPQQPIENIPSPLGSFNMTTIHPSQSEIFSFDIPGFKIIVIPTFSQQDNTYLNYSSSITDTQFDQFQQ